MDIDEWDFLNPKKTYKYNIGEFFIHKKFGKCTIFDIEDDIYYVTTESGTKMRFVASMIDNISDDNFKEQKTDDNFKEQKINNTFKRPSDATVVAGQYKSSDGQFKGKEYFFKDRINNGKGGLQIGDIGLAYNFKAKKCVPIQITRLNISPEEIKENNVDKKKMIYINFKGE